MEIHKTRIVKDVIIPTEFKDIEILVWKDRLLYMCNTSLGASKRFSIIHDMADRSLAAELRKLTNQLEGEYI